MSRFFSLGMFSALGCYCLTLLGCNRPPPPPKVTDLQFPVLVVYPDVGFDTFVSPDDLNTMGTQRVLMHKDVPALIDSGLRIYMLENLRSTKNGFSLWLSGGMGPTPVAFDLAATKESGLVAARAWICRGTNQFDEGPSAEDERKMLEAATNLAELAEVALRPPG